MCDNSEKWSSAPERAQNASDSGKVQGKKMKSKESYGQICGLSNLEMKHVGKLASIGALLRATASKNRESADS